MLCQFQVCSEMNHLHINIYLLFLRFFSHISQYSMLRRVPCTIQQVLLIYFLPNRVSWFWYFWRVQDNCFVECPQSGWLSTSSCLDLVGPQGLFSILCTAAHAAFLAVIPSRSDCLLGIGCAHYITTQKPPPYSPYQRCCSENGWGASVQGRPGLPRAWQGCCHQIPLWLLSPVGSVLKGSSLNLLWLPLSFVTDELSDILGS